MGINEFLSKNMKIANIVYNTFTNDSRILKEVTSVATINAVTEIRIFALHMDGLELSESLGSKTNVQRIPTLSEKLPNRKIFTLIKLLEWHARVLWRLFKFSPSHLHLHDIIPLVPGIIYKILKPSTYFIYDAHELETGTNIATGWRKRSYFLIEKIASVLANGFITVSPQIKEFYDHHFAFKNSIIVLNCPLKRSSRVDDQYFRNYYKLKSSDHIFLYQGALSKGRGVEILLKVFTDLPENFHIVFLGFGPLSNLIIESNERHGNVHFHPAVSAEKVHEVTPSADIGLCLIESTCKSYELCLPNKLFEYIHAGIPIIASNLVNLQRVVEGHNIGKVIKSQRIEDFKSIIFSIVHEKKKYKNNIIGLSDLYQWEIEGGKLRDLYWKFSNKN